MGVRADLGVGAEAMLYFTVLSEPKGAMVVTFVASAAPGVTATGMELFVTMPAEAKGAAVAVPVLAETTPDTGVTVVDVLAATEVAVAAMGVLRDVAVVATSGIELATSGATTRSGESTSHVQIGGGLALRVLGVEDGAAEAAARDAKLGEDAACNGLAGVARGSAGDTSEAAD